MNYSKITICNKALSSLSAKPITQFDDDSTEAELCRAQFDVVRQVVLEDHAWSFAIKRRVLTKQLEKPAFGFCSQFSRPANCIRILKVTDNSGAPDPLFNWAIEDGNILCDAETIQLTYIYDNLTTDDYSSSFVDALATRLAAELAYPLTESSELYKAMFNQYLLKIENAKTNDSVQGVNIPVHNNRFAR